MRIIAGSLKGRRLVTPRWAGLRPTSDKLRETLFNVVAPRVPGARVLDGFAGTGALGIEALSRGAAEVSFVDSDPRAVRLIAENLRRCDVAQRCAIIRAELQDAVRRRLPAEHFDLVLLDPPYDAPDLDTILEGVARVLAPGGLIVLEHPRRRPVSPAVAGLKLVRTVPSGDSALALYRPAPAARSVSTGA